MTRSEYIELRAELRNASDVRLYRISRASAPRIFNVRRTQAGKVSVRLLEGWTAALPGDEIIVNPLTRNEYRLMPWQPATETGRV